MSDPVGEYAFQISSQGRVRLFAGNQFMLSVTGLTAVAVNHETFHPLHCDQRSTVCTSFGADGSCEDCCHLLVVFPTWIGGIGSVLLKGLAGERPNHPY